MKVIKYYQLSISLCESEYENNGCQTKKNRTVVEGVRAKHIIKEATNLKGSKTGLSIKV